MPRKTQNSDKTKRAGLSLTTRDLAALVKVCKRNKVMNLSYDGLEINFMPSEKAQNFIPKVSNISESPVVDLEQNAAPGFDPNDREEFLDHMLITEPGRYEKLIADGEFDAGN